MKKPDALNNAEQLLEATDVKRLTAYPAYKPVGIEWLGDLPEHWTVKRLKHLCLRWSLYGANISTDDYMAEGVRFLRTSDIDDCGRLLNNNPVYVSKEEARNYILSDGDLLLSRSGTLGRSFVFDASAHELAAYAGYLVRYCLSGDVLPQYVFYFTKSTGFTQWVEEMSISSTIGNVNAQKFANITLPFPLFEEQQDIARFLDEKTKKIDDLIEAKQKLLELLKEKRQAVITHAVTRGLDSNVKLKSSGIDWLGEVPEHWEIKRLKYLASLNDETLSEATEPSFEFSYVDIGNVDATQGILAKEPQTFQDAPSRARRIVREGDTIVSTVRTYLRAIAPIRGLEDSLIVSTGFAVVRPREVYPQYLSFVLCSPYFVETVVSRSTGVSYPAISASEIGYIFLPLPPCDEQQDIARFLDEQTKKINDLVEATQAAVEQLHEYRNALISAAVTGKLDVRGYLA